MTQKEKADAYDEIIAKAQKMHDENIDACKACIEELIPSIKEKENKGEHKPVKTHKFSVGNTIRHKKYGFTCKIVSIDTEYHLSECMGNHLPFEAEDFYELVEQKSTEWAQEDDNCLQMIIEVLERLESGAVGEFEEKLKKQKSWLKSLYSKYHWKPQQTIMDSLNFVIIHPDRMTDYNVENLRKLYEQLKSL